MSENIQESNKEQIKIETELVAGHIRCLSSVPVDLEALLAELEAEENENA